MLHKKGRKARHREELAKLEAHYWGNVPLDMEYFYGEAEVANNRVLVKEQEIADEMLSKEAKKVEATSENTAVDLDLLQNMKHKNNRQIHNSLVRLGFFEQNKTLQEISSKRSVEDTREEYQSFVKKLYQIV